MLFEGRAVRVTVAASVPEAGIAELCLDLQGESVNKFNQLTLTELDQAVTRLAGAKDIRGLLITSGKAVFSVGADITEFLPAFEMPETEIAAWVGHAQAIFSRLEDLPFPSVACINGIAVGGGLEAALAATYRVAAAAATVGQPEVKLGLLPGFGGTVRLPRLIGSDNAIDLIASGRDVKADEALKLKIVSAVVAPDKLREAGLSLLRRSAADGSWKKAVARKKSPLILNGIERIMAFTTAKAFVAQQAGPHYPAPRKAVEVMEQAATDGRDAALAKEAAAFAQLGKSPEAAGLIQIFLGDQYLKKRAKQLSAAARPVKHAAVAGAGIMGGGIAYQSASRGVPVVVKDIREEALQAAFGEIARLLSRQVERGRLTQEDMAKTLAAVQGTLTYGDFAHADIAIEAVVENPAVKAKVLQELEAAMPKDAVIATNTSTIPLALLAKSLQDDTRFCGMHFFNPVYRMPLVEVIRGPHSSDAAIATTVAYAQKMGKSPVVVNDCPGFLVNRILAPYMAAFQLLVADGAPIEGVDKAMEGFGWPMGPAYLNDVVGLDTAYHAGQVMAQAFPDRFQRGKALPGELLFKAGYLGQKNGKGFYRYETDKRGGQKKVFDPAVLDVIAPAIVAAQSISGEEIVERMMLPMVIEAARCLDDRIVASPQELDMALVLGLGFPPFRGGLLRWADRVGLAGLVSAAGRCEALGGLYAPTAGMQALAKESKGFY